MQTFYKLFRWPIRLLDWAGTHTVRLFGLHPTSDHASVYTEEELRNLIDVSRKSGHLKSDEQQLLHRVFEFSGAEVREAMVPRIEIEALPVTATREEARALFLSTGYSRLPVYRDRLDDMVGLLLRKDLDMGQTRADEFSLERLAHPPVFTPASASLGDALKQMQLSRTHFVFVVDEHGGLEGILTLEDLLEEIVGEINDEYDEEVREQITKDEGTFLLDGMLAVRDANQRLGLGLSEDEGYTTVAGFLMAQSGRLLKPGDTVEYGGGAFHVERVDRFRIRRVRFTPARKNERESKPSALVLPFISTATMTQVSAELSACVDLLSPCF
jgi:CBS domain containing-hemolysin-like protein